MFLFEAASSRTSSFSLVRVSLSRGEALAGMVRKACRKARRQKVQLAEQPGVLTGVPGLKRALWQPLQTGLVFKSTRKPQICMLFVFQASFPGMWNEMNEWTVFSLQVVGWIQKSRPQWGSNHWSSLDQKTVGGYLCNLYVYIYMYTHTLSQIYERRQKQSHRQTNILLSPESPVKAQKQNPQNLF